MNPCGQNVEHNLNDLSLFVWKVALADKFNFYLSITAIKVEICVQYDYFETFSNGNSQGALHMNRYRILFLIIFCSMSPHFLSSAVNHLSLRGVKQHRLQPPLFYHQPCCRHHKHAGNLERLVRPCEWRHDRVTCICIPLHLSALLGSLCKAADVLGNAAIRQCRVFMWFSMAFKGMVALSFSWKLSCIESFNMFLIWRHQDDVCITADYIYLSLI